MQRLTKVTMANQARPCVYPELIYLQHAKVQYASGSSALVASRLSHCLYDDPEVTVKGSDADVVE